MCLDPHLIFAASEMFVLKLLDNWMRTQLQRDMVDLTIRTAAAAAASAWSEISG